LSGQSIELRIKDEAFNNSVELIIENPDGIKILLLIKQK
jgi:hypothetical protein